MVRLRDCFSSDLNVFLNPDEFGEIHTLDSKGIMMVIEDDSFNQKAEQNQNFENATEGVYDSLITIYVKATDYKKPSVGKRVTLDNKKYYVVSASNQDGLLKIVLGANES
jgi:hypothetical protein